MASKKRRQRGSRTHGGGSHKNRRGAGNRGGRGNAGRSKHQIHGQEPLGKKGFTRPQKAQEEVVEIKLRRLDEDVPLYVAEKKAQKIGDDHYLIDARKIANPSNTNEGSVSSQPQVKVLGNGQVTHQLELIADDCTSQAREKVEGQDGRIRLTGVGGNGTMYENIIAKRNKRSNGHTGNCGSVGETLDEFESRIKNGDPLQFQEVERILEVSETETNAERSVKLLNNYYQSIDDMDASDAVNLLQTREFAQKHNLDYSKLDDRLEKYFDDLDYTEKQVEDLREDLPSELSISDVLDGLDYIRRKYNRAFDMIGETDQEMLECQEKAYIKSVSDRILT